jgi:sugar lactone lactonase YvrE
VDLEVEDVLQIGNLLGEGPVWDSEKGLLFWVDIEEHCFHSMCPAAAVAVRKFDVGVPVYSLGLVAGSDKLVMATSRGFALWNSPDGSLEAIADPEEGRPAGRLNDAAVDRQGNFWAGSLGPGFTSALYRLGPRRSVQKVESGIGASNGIGWSPDNRTMYFTDTRHRVIFAYDFDASSSTVANRRIWARVPEGEGVPDGLTVDSEGCVWSVRWGFARVARYDPTGRLEREIALPVTYPTSCTFGGANLDELYVTSARSPLSQSLAAREPCAGDLFRIGVGVRGIEEARFRE